MANNYRVNTIVKVDVEKDDTSQSIFNSMVSFIAQYKNTNEKFYKDSVLAGIKFGSEYTSVTFELHDLDENRLTPIIKTMAEQQINFTLVWEDFEIPNSEDVNRVYYLKIKWAEPDGDSN